MYDLTKKELKFLNKYNTPRKIQSFINKIPMNFEEETCYSPRTVLIKNSAHCMEGAMLAALMLRLIGHKPLLVDLTASKEDYDHVVAVFKEGKHWGAISKTNHSVLRYREPVYKTVRELVMSYFHEYFMNKNGKKTLRSYSKPIDLTKFDKQEWITSIQDVWSIPEYLCDVKHYPILNKKQLIKLRKADPVEIEAGKIEEWKN